jgi:hypothetical protein
MGRVNALEQRFPVDTWKYQGVDLWPLIRFEIFRMQGKGLDASSGWQGWMARLPQAVRSSLDALRLLMLRPQLVKFFWGRCDALVASHSAYQKYSFAGKILDPYADRLILENQELGLKTHKWEFNGIAPFNLKGSYLGFPSALVFYPLKTAARLKFRFSRRGEVLPAFVALHGNLGQDLSTDALEKSVLQSVFVIRLVSQVLKKILTLKGVKKVYVTAYYSEPQMALLLAARELGIPTVDLQHGVQARAHKAYGSWSKVPPEGYNVLPDEFAVWSEVEMQIRKDWGKPAESIPRATMIGPSPLLLRQKLGDHEGIPAWLSSIRVRERKLALLSTQPTVDFIRFLKESTGVGDYFWLIRLHPRMRGDLTVSLKALSEIPDLRFEIQKSTAANLFPLLESCDVHVTGYSTVATEASWFGKKTLTFHPFGPTCFPELTDAGWLQPWEEGLKHGL